MKVKRLHDWDMTPSEAISLQKELAGQLVLETPPGWECRTVAGCDVSCERHGKTFYAAVVVLALPSLEKVAEATAVGQAPFPYVPGLLSFREAPVSVSYTHLTLPTN